MPLLRRYRRWWSLSILCLLCTPLLLQLASGHASFRASSQEGRQLPQLPDLPTGFWTLKNYPRAWDKYLGDHFGGRSALVGLNQRLRFALSSPSTPRVTYGTGDWLFYADDQVMQQAMGEQMRGKAIAYLADLTAEMQARLSSEGREFIAALMPNKHSIHREHLPTWAQQPPTATEYDLFLAEMARVEVRTVDLRLPLRSAAGRTPVYKRTDTHWNNLGALLAFNTLATAMDKPDWAIAPEAALGAQRSATTGDLARFLGGASLLKDENFGWRLPDPKDRMHEWGDNRHKSYDLQGFGSGGTILVIGDSFSRDFFRPLLARNASRLVWMHHERCRFDWSELERFQPDSVLLLIVERYAASCAGNRPRNMPASVLQEGKVPRAAAR